MDERRPPGEFLVDSMARVLKLFLAAIFIFAVLLNFFNVAGRYLLGLSLIGSDEQLHAANGSMVFSKKLSRGKLLSFLASQPKCTVAMEACASAPHWGSQRTRPEKSTRRAILNSASEQDVRTMVRVRKGCGSRNSIMMVEQFFP